MPKLAVTRIVSPPTFELLDFEAVSYTVNSNLGLGSVDMSENQQEFLSPETAADVRLASIWFKQLGESLEHRIARIMSVGVVDPFEMIQVSNHYPERKIVPRGRAELAVYPNVDGTAVGQPTLEAGEVSS
jgi:hypothetical protein